TAGLLAAESTHADQRDRSALTVVSNLDSTPSSPSNTHQTRLILDLFHLAQYDLATQRGVLRKALLSLDIDLRTIGMERIDELLDQIRTAQASGPHPLLGGWQWTIFERDNTFYLSFHQASSLPYAVEHPHLATSLAAPMLIPLQGTLSDNSLLEGWQLHSTL